MDPQLTSDGRPFAPVRFEQIVEERYQISKRIHTSYNELGDITPRERLLLLDLLRKDIEHENEITQKFMDKSKR